MSKRVPVGIVCALAILGAAGLARAQSQTNVNVYGFTAGASLGALLFRTANAQMNLEGNAEVMLSELADEFPTVYSATVGVFF